MAVKIVGGYVYLVGFRHRRDLHGMEYAVPRQIDNRYVHGVIFKEKVELLLMMEGDTCNLTYCNYQKEFPSFR